MKTKVIALVLAIGMVALPVSGASTARSFVVAGSPLSLLLGGIDALALYKINRYVAISVPGSIYYFWPLSTIANSIAKKRAESFELIESPIKTSIGLGLRIYPMGNAYLDALYIEPQFNFHYQSFSAKSSTNRLEFVTSSVEGLAQVGYEWHWKSGITTSLGAGCGYRFFIKNNADVSGRYLDSSYAGLIYPYGKQRGQLVFEIQFRVGFAF